MFILSSIKNLDAFERLRGGGKVQLFALAPISSKVAQEMLEQAKPIAILGREEPQNEEYLEAKIERLESKLLKLRRALKYFAREVIKREEKDVLPPRPPSLEADERPTNFRPPFVRRTKEHSRQKGRNK